MSSVELTPPVILDIAKVCQYMASNSISNSNNFKGNYIDPVIARMIYSERKCVQIRYDANPNDPTLIATSLYLYALLGGFALRAQARLASFLVAPPTVFGPANRTVNVGQNAVFSVTVDSEVPYTVQWYDSSNNPIAGETGLSYTFPNAQLSDSGKQFYVKATNSAGQVTSQIGVLVVNAILQGQFAYMPNNPYPTLQSSLDPFNYQVVFSIAHNNDFIVTMPAASAPNQYLIVRVPVGEPLKAHWFNDNFNNGDIPDFNWQTLLQFGGFTYYCSRQALSLNTSATLKLQA